MAKIGIVIVNYNGAAYQNTDFEIIVVDSGSKDNSIELLEKDFPKVHVLKQNENVGVAKGNNIGIEYSLSLQTEYTLLMNNDIEVNEMLLDNLLSVAEDDAVVVPKIYYYEPNDLLWFAGGDFIFNKGLTIHFGKKELDNGQYDDLKIINYAPTCCMLIKNSIFSKVGKMDENYFMYYDDTDFCLRLMENDIKIIYQPKAIMWHKVSSSTGGEDSPLSVYYNTRNRFYFINKHSKMMPIRVKIYSLISNIVQYIIYPIRCKNDKYIRLALIDYYKGNMGRKELL